MFFMLVNITPKNQWNGKLGEGNYFRQQRKYTHTPDIHTHTEHVRGRVYKDSFKDGSSGSIHDIITYNTTIMSPPPRSYAKVCVSF